MRFLTGARLNHAESWAPSSRLIFEVVTTVRSVKDSSQAGNFTDVQEDTHESPGSEPGSDVNQGTQP